MLAKNEVLEILRKHLKGTESADAIDRIADDIVGLVGDWEELPVERHKDEMGFTLRNECSDICYLAEQFEKSDKIRVFKKSK